MMDSLVLKLISRTLTRNWQGPARDCLSSYDLPLRGQLELLHLFFEAEDHEVEPGALCDLLDDCWRKVWCLQPYQVRADSRAPGNWGEQNTQVWGQLRDQLGLVPRIFIPPMVGWAKASQPTLPI